MKKLILGLSLAVLSISVANAQSNILEGPPNPDRVEISKEKLHEKFMDKKAEIFSAMDENKDGKVTKEEYLAHHNKAAEKRFDEIDEGKKGAITKEEFMDKKPEFKGKGGPRDGRPQRGQERVIENNEL